MKTIYIHEGQNCVVGENYPYAVPYVPKADYDEVLERLDNANSLRSLAHGQAAQLQPVSSAEMHDMTDVFDTTHIAQ